MNDDEWVRAVLRQTGSRPGADDPRHDLWPRLAGRLDEPRGFSWFDAGLAAAIVLVLSMVRGSLWLLAYHL